MTSLGVLLRRGLLWPNLSNLNAFVGELKLFKSRNGH